MTDHHDLQHWVRVHGSLRNALDVALERLHVLAPDAELGVLFRIWLTRYGRDEVLQDIRNRTVGPWAEQLIVILGNAIERQKEGKDEAVAHHV